MAFTQSQITALEKAIASGSTRVKMGEREITYRNLDEMQRILDVMRRDVSGGSGKAAVYVSSTSRGY